MLGTRADIIPNTPDTKEGYNFLYANIPLLVLCVVVVAFRLWWRCIKNGPALPNKADICVIICVIFNIIQVTCISIAILRWGFGHHAPYLTAEQRYESLFYFFIFQCFVKNTVGITKLSFLFLYLDIFPQRKFRILCWAMVIQISLGLIALSITTILQCNPIPFSWDKSIPGGTCINIKAFWYGQSGWNTFMDVVVLVMPIPVVIKLKMNRRGKLGLLAVFLLGTFVCITSIERMISLNFNSTFAKDFTWATGTSVIWTQVESTVGVICACAPSLRSPLARFIPKLFGSEGSEESYQLSDDAYNPAGPRSGNWPGSPKRSKQGSRTLDYTVSTMNSTFKGETSEERIIGITKRVSIDLSSTERKAETNQNGAKTFETYQYDRHAPV